MEQCFDYLKNSVQIGEAHKRTNTELEAWPFINHISLLYFYGVVKALREKELNGKYSPEDILSIGKISTVSVNTITARIPGYLSVQYTFCICIS